MAETGFAFTTFATNVKNFFTEFKSASPLFPHLYSQVITVTKHQTLLEAFQVLIDNKILSVPVIEASSRKVVGAFSMKDFMNIFITFVNEKDLHAEKDLMSILEKKGIANKPITEFEEVGKLEPMFTVNGNEPLLKPAEIMVKTRAHRVIVINEAGQLINVVTQSRMIAILSTLLDNIPDSTKTLRELNLGLKPVISIPHNITAFQAFKMLRDKNATALPVVNDKGVLIGNLSVNDLKLLGYKLEFFKLLALPLTDYLRELQNPEKAPLIRKKEIQQLLTVRPEDTLAFAMKLLYVYRVHRLYVVDDKGMPVGVLSLHDILRQIATPYFSSTQATQ